MKISALHQFSFLRWVWISVPLLLAVALYLVNPTGWQIADDEGVYLYQAWRISLGEWPYRDFLTAQQPLFIGLGGLITWLTGPSQAALRLLSQLAALAATGALGQALRRFTRRPWAAWAAALIFLMHPLTLQTCRLYLSEPFMLLGVTTGLNLLARWQDSQRRRWLLLTSLAFALATLCKLFAVLPWAGVAAFLIYDSWRSGQKRHLAGDGLVFLLPVVGLGAVMLALDRLVGPYFTDTMGHHFLAGAGVSWGQNALNKLHLLGAYAAQYPLLTILAGIGAGYTLTRRNESGDGAALAWMLFSVAGLFFMQRELGPRHLLVFMPALAGLSAVTLAQWDAALQQSNRPYARAVSLLLLVPMLVVARWLPANLNQARRSERQTGAVVAYLQEQTAPGSTILSDYLELNFLSQRPTLPSAAGLHHAATASGQITASELIAQLASSQAPWVMLDVSPSTGSTLVGLLDYPTFHNYLQDFFQSVATFNRENQLLEIWRANEPLPQVAPQLAPQHPLDEQIGDLAQLQGYTLDGQPAPNQTLTLGLFWQAQAPTSVGYSVFVHLLQADGAWVSGWDSEPLGGRYPTWRWRPGQIIPDRRSLPLPPDLQAGDYYLAVGMYDWRSGARLPALQADGKRWPQDSIILTPLHVSPGE